MPRAAQAPVQAEPSAPTMAGPPPDLVVEPSTPPSFDWPLAYEAEQLLRRHVHLFLKRNSFAALLEQRMRDETATDFFEWIDHLSLPVTEENTLRQAGFAPANETETPDGATVYEH